MHTTPRNAAAIAAAAALLTACATTLDPNYAMQLDAYRLTIASQQSVEVAKARAEEARYNAMANIAGGAEPQTKQMALLALALARVSGGDARAINVVLPNAPESQEDRALKWAAIFAGPLTSVAQGYFGYRLGVTQSNNTAQSTIASYNSLGLVAASGFSANSNIAGAAFAALPLFKPSTPNINIGGNGVVGAGSYTGDNSGAASGNAGTIRIQSPDTTTHTCAGGTTDAGGATGASC